MRWSRLVTLTLAFAVLPVCAWADAAAPAATAIPPVAAMVLPARTTVHVPTNGDVTAQRATRANVVELPFSSPAPHAQITKGVPLPVLGVPFVCGPADCYFTQMPLYNQGNPNFAYVDVPANVYNAELAKVTGPLYFDRPFNHWAVSVANHLDPFYESWLPYGPLPGDANNIDGWWMTGICGPTAEAMALMAAISAKRSTTVVRPGSWVDVAFLNAAKPASQRALPAPLQIDHNTLADKQMSAQELQRVINTALLQRTDPTRGGLSGAYLAQARVDFQHGGGPSQPVVVTDDGTKHITASLLVDLVRQRYATVVGIHPYQAIVTVSSAGRYIGFARTGGHVLALNGFTNGNTATPSFVFYDPVYANVLHKTIVQLTATAPARGRQPITTATLPGGVSDAAIIQYDTSPTIASIADIAHGQTVYFLDEYHALKLE